MCECLAACIYVYPSAPPELKLWIVVNYSIDDGNQTQFEYKSSKWSWPLPSKEFVKCDSWTFEILDIRELLYYIIIIKVVLS